MAELTTMKYDGQKGMQQHILNMTKKAAKLKALGMGMDEFFLVQFVLNYFHHSLLHSKSTIILTVISGT